MVGRIVSKSDMACLYKEGVFGNRLHVWTLADFPVTWTKPVTLMYRGTPGVTPPGYGTAIPPNEVPALVRVWCALGYDRERIAVSENDGHLRITIQGEVQETERHLDLFYSRVNSPMRASLRIGGTPCHGLVAHTLLREAMDPPSWENLWRLFDEYPGHVVEFTCWERTAGLLAYNTVFWEVRAY